MLFRGGLGASHPSGREGPGEGARREGPGEGARREGLGEKDPARRAARPYATMRTTSWMSWSMGMGFSSAVQVRIVARMPER